MNKRIVIKLGTQVVMDVDGLGAHFGRLWCIVRDIAELRAQGLECIVVSSGAIGLGRKALGLSPSARKGEQALLDKQACAAVGQTLLMNTYRDLCAPYGVLPAQVLITAEDFAQRSRYLSLAGALERLIEMRCLPIINENDLLSAGQPSSGEKGDSKQKSFADNDKLAALVAGKLGAQTLLLLSNVEGVYEDNPATNPQAKLLRTIDNLNQLTSVRASGASALGRGGMASKLEAAKLAGMCGVETIIASGNGEHSVREALSGKCGTRISPMALLGSKLPSRKRWIAAGGYSGTLIVNRDAKAALLARRISLLPVGIVECEGDFRAKDLVSIQDQDRCEIARGIVEFPASIVRTVLGKRSSEARLLEPRYQRDEIVHCDNMVLFVG
jgi:glutamate 5-kinase